MLLTGGLATILLGLGALGQALLALSVAPTPGLLLRLAAGAFGSVSSVALGVGVLGGVARGVVRLREERALLALAAAGLRPGRLGLLAGAVCLPGVLLHLAVGHFGEPLARAQLRDARVAVASALDPRTDRPVRIGPWWVAEQAGGGLWFTDGVRAGRADRWRLVPHQGGVAADLGGVVLAAAEGVAVRADRLELPIPLAARRVHIFERTTPDLRAQIAVSAALGRDTYERWTLWKRTLLSAVLVPLSIAAAGFARRRGEGVVVGGLVLGTWVVVRLLDAQVAAIGLGPTTVLFIAWAAVVATAAWRR